MADDETIVERFASYRPDRDTRAHYEGRLRRELLVQRCSSCGTWHHPPRPICPSCWSTEVVPTAVSGRGTIHLVTVLHQGPPTEGVDYDRGYPVVAVELAEQEGLRFTATVVGASPDEIRIGDAVELAWIERAGVPVPAFRLVRDAS